MTKTKGQQMQIGAIFQTSPNTHMHFRKSMKKLISAHHNGRMTRISQSSEFSQISKNAKGEYESFFHHQGAATKILLLVLGGWLEGRERSSLLCD
jgi:hypothetical protein